MTTPRLARRERLALCDTFDELGPDAPTLCSPWRAAQLAAHLVLREGRPDVAAGIALPFLAARTERATEELAAREPWPSLVDQVRGGPPFWSPTRLGAVDEVVNLVEFVVHHEDVLRGDGKVGPRREVDDALAKGVWGALKAGSRLMLRKSPVGVSFVVPGRAPFLAHGGEDVVTVTGEPVELLLVAYGRHQVAEVSWDGDPGDISAVQETALGF